VNRRSAEKPLRGQTTHSQHLTGERIDSYGPRLIFKPRVSAARINELASSAVTVKGFSR